MKADKINIVDVTGVNTDDGYKTAKTIDKGNNDTQENIIYTIEGFESLPLSGNKKIILPTQSGEHIVTLSPLKTNIQQGERRINATTLEGVETASFYLKQNGEIELKNNTLTSKLKETGKLEITNQTAELMSVVSVLFSELDNAMNYIATLNTAVATLMGTPATPPVPLAQITASLATISYQKPLLNSFIV